VGPAIEIRDLTKRYGDRCAVDHLGFSVPEGTVCGFVGPNGAGKTTTIRMLLGLMAPSEGTGEVLGHPMSRPSAYLPRVGAMIEGPAFYPSLSGRRNLEVLARMGGIDRRAVGDALEVVDLTDRARDRYGSYSLGMKQRLGIAAALLPRPDLLVLDEPTNGLDPPGIRDLRALLRSLADGGMTVFVSSHLLDELQHTCDHLVVIDQGRLIFSGHVTELLRSHEPKLSVVPEDRGRLADVVRLCEEQGRAAVALDDRVLVSASADFAGELNRLTMRNGITLCELGVVPVRLEDAFFHLTSAGRAVDPIPTAMAEPVPA
jgi:ABC-2 type transport system ATP-binding protein